MHFEMFTEHEAELFALHINFLNLNEFFLSICMQHTDKNVPRKCFLGAFFWYCVLQDRWSFRGLLSLDPLQSRGPGPTGELIAPPPRQPATPGNEIQSLHIVFSAGYHFHPCSSRQIWPTTLNSLKKGL